MKKTIIIALSVVVILIASACLILHFNMENQSVVINTVNDLFINPDKFISTTEKLINKGYKTKFEIKIDGEEANRTSDVSFSAESLVWGSGEETRERFDYTFTVNENEHRASLAFDDNKLYIVGYDRNGEQFCIYLPLDNISEQLDGSVLDPSTESKYAMNQELYDKLKKALENEHDNVEDDLEAFIKDLLPKIKEEIILHSTTVKSTTTITLKESTLKKLVEIAFDELSEHSSLIKKLGLDKETLDTYERSLTDSLSGYYAQIAYTVFGNKLTSAHLNLEHKVNNSAKKLEFDVSITSKGNTDSLILTIDSNVDSGADIIRNSSKLEYSKTKKFGKTVINLVLTSDASDGEDKNMKFVLTTNSFNNKYNLDYYPDGAEEPEMTMSGKAGFYSLIPGYYFTVDRYIDEDVNITDLLNLSVKSSKKGKKMSIPEGENFFELTEGHLESIINNIDFNRFDQSLWMGFNKKFNLSKDNLPIMNYSAALNKQKEIKQLFELYRKHIDRNVNKIYYYIESCGVYTLIEYKENSGYKSQFYVFPGNLLDSYHMSQIVNDQFFVHEYQLKEKIQPDCYNGGYELYQCKQCGKEYKTNKSSNLGHIEERVEFEYSYNIDAPVNAIFMYCTRCNNLLRFEFGENRYISFFEGSASVEFGVKHFIIPEQIVEYCDISGVKINPTTSASGLLSVRVPDGREVIKANDFSAATKLQVIVIPGSVTEIEDGAFYNENPLRTIFYIGTADEWEKVELNGYESIWSDVEVVFVPEGIEDSVIMTECVDN